ncbi:MAG TPA: hypothetical protein VKY26_02275 [Actinomycetota bacterium]|nr:hypothetical protein [Actinomycetota bacterium]
MVELVYRCQGCGLATRNPTMILVCSSCGRHLCAACMREHEPTHEPEG